MEVENNNNGYFTRSKALEQNNIKQKKIKNSKDKKKNKTDVNNTEEISKKYENIEKGNDTGIDSDNLKSTFSHTTLPKKIVTLKKKDIPQNKNKKDIFQNKETYKINISNSADKLLTSMLINKAMNFIKNKNKKKYSESDSETDSEISDSDSEFNSESESNHDELDDIPEDVIYTEEEEEYLKSLSENKRKKFIEIENQILDYDKSLIPHRFKIMQTNLPLSIKSLIIKKLDLYYTLDEGDNEFHKLSQWIDSVNLIPFDKYTPTIINITDPSPKIVKHLYNVKKTLDQSIYGHEFAKTQIIQELARQITNPKSNGNSIAIQGPPGNGKTTLIKDGVCKAINRPFAFIPLGGMQNSEFLIGHDYTYEGAKCGRIVEILQESKTMNPIIYFDELDKLSETSKGDEISNLLCHLTDFSQNNAFQDKYFSGIDFDLSKATFIFSYNDETKINPILLDRLYRIQTKGFNNSDKLKIAEDYLIPKLLDSFALKKDDITLNNDVIEHIINQYTMKEEGVRNLKRCIETIMSKINVLRLIHGYSLYNINATNQKNNKIKSDIDNEKQEILEQKLYQERLKDKKQKEKEKKKKKKRKKK
tara:strand:- start:5446 stop:7218 length:1773 start_codon:yes stop_codon:yes gene_type:complete